MGGGRHCSLQLEVLPGGAIRLDVDRWACPSFDSPTSPLLSAPGPPTLHGSFTAGPPSAMWIQVKPPSGGNAYYFNEALGVSRWSRPERKDRPLGRRSEQVQLLGARPISTLVDEWSQASAKRINAPVVPMPTPPPAPSLADAALPSRPMPFLSKTVQATLVQPAVRAAQQAEEEATTEEDDDEQTSVAAEARVKRPDASAFAVPRRPAAVSLDRGQAAEDGVSEGAAAEEADTCHIREAAAPPATAALRPARPPPPVKPLVRGTMPRALYDKLQNLREDGEQLASFRKRMQASLAAAEQAKLSDPAYRSFPVVNAASVGDWSPRAREALLGARQQERRRFALEASARRTDLMAQAVASSGRAFARGPYSPRSSSRSRCEGGWVPPLDLTVSSHTSVPSSPRSGSPRTPRPTPPTPSTHRGRARHMASKLSQMPGHSPHSRYS
mgnify:CR=1 FL=1